MHERPTIDAGKLYEILSESAGDAIVTIDEHGVILSVNPAGERLFGYPVEELIGMPMTRLMPARMIGRHEAGMARYLATGNKHISWRGVRMPILTRDGREIPVEISFGEFVTDGHHIFSAILRDQSERMAGEAALVASNSALEEARRAAEHSAMRVREVLENLGDAVSVFDRNWCWTYANPATRALLSAMGRSVDGVIGRDVWEALPELVGTRFETETRRAWSEGVTVMFEEFLPMLGRWFEIRAVPSPNGVTTFTRDITDVRDAAEVLRMREEEYRALANSIPTLAWMARPDGWLFWYNDRWYEYTGTTPADMEGWGWQSVHDPVALSTVVQRWRASIASGESFEMTFPLRGADGVFRPFLTRVFPLRNNAGEVIRWFGTNTDVSQERAARLAAERSEERMRQLQRLTSLLASATSLDGVASVVVREAAQATGASSGMLARRDDLTNEAVMLGETGLPEDVKSEYGRFSLHLDTPTAECIRTNAPIFVGSGEGPEGSRARYPAMTRVLERVRGSALAAVPLTVNGRAVAAMSFTFSESREFTEEERGFFLTLAAQGAQAFQRVEAFDAERRERRRSASIVEAITDGFVTLDSELRFTYVNEHAATMFSLSRAELQGRALPSLPKAEDSPLLHVAQTVVLERKPRQMEGYSTIMKRWLDLRGYPAEDGGVIVYFKDLTERRRRQEVVSFLAEASDILASSTDYNTTLANVARALVPRFGDWCAVDLLAGGDSDGASPRLERVAMVPDNATPYAVAKELVRTPSAALSDPDGVSQVMSIPITARNQTLGTLSLGMSQSGRRYTENDLAVGRDIGRRAGMAIDAARLLRDAQEARDRAEEANAAKLAFLATMSHELRTPLNAISGHVQIIDMGLHGPVNDAQRAALDRVSKAQVHLLGIINDILTYAKVDSGRLDYRLARFDPAQVVRQVAELLDAQFASMQLELRVDIPETLLTVTADRDKLTQVLLNLLSNALKFTPSPGVVTVRLQGDSRMTQISVSDTGMGIPEEKREAIFEPFVQLGRALNSAHVGTGLGLSISRDLVRGMKGDLTVSSVFGEGASFTLSLPS